MSRYFFRVEDSRHSCTSDLGLDAADRGAAWTETTKVCGDLIGAASRQLEQNAGWQIELLDETQKPVFRIRLSAETLP
jgi:hypothetical protein